MKIYSRQYMLRSYNNANTSCYNKIPSWNYVMETRYIVLILYDNIVDNCQLIKYNLQDTFSLFRNSIMLFQLVKSKFQDAFM